MSSKSQKRPCATVGLVEAISKATDPLPPTVGVLSATLYMLQSPVLFLLLRTLLHRANSTSFFSSDSELLAQKHPGVGYPFASRTETRTSDAPQEKCLSNSLPVPRECIGRTIGAGDSLRQAIPGPRVPSFPSTFICVGGCD